MAKRCFWVMLVALGVGAVQARAADPLSDEVRQAYTRVKGFIVKAAEKMPEENYGFQPTKEIRNFGQLLAHVADAQTRNCNAVKGAPKQGNAASKTSKAELIAALNESFADCDGAYQSLTDATAAESITVGQNQRTRLGILAGNTTHDNEMYGVMGVYMRLKGLVPPSSEGR